MRAASVRCAWSGAPASAASVSRPPPTARRSDASRGSSPAAGSARATWSTPSTTSSTSAASRTRAAPSCEQRVRAARPPRRHRPRQGAHVAPEVGGDLGGDERARAFGGLDHDGHVPERGDRAVARREAPPERREPGRHLGHDAALVEDAPVQPALARRIRHVGAAGEHGDRCGPAVERAGVGGAVDPERHSADDPDAGGADPARERPRDLVALGRRAARADDRHQRRIGPVRAAREADEPADRIGRRGDEENDRRVAEIVQPHRVGGVVPADGGECRRVGRRAEVARVGVLELRRDVAAGARAERLDQPLRGQREQLAQHALLVARDLDRAAEAGHEPRSPEAGVAGVDGHATASPSRSCSWR